MQDTVGEIIVTLPKPRREGGVDLVPLSPDPASSMLGRRAAHLQGHRLSTRPPRSKYWAGVCRLHMTSEDGS